ncbi:MAG: alanine--glyoxylate aminotransferase family protein, partial [Phycisphaerae bacterium]|nr:alanine--glyoxylate aminotransferase family protein [Phycisphaerae bacterium]
MLKKRLFAPGPTPVAEDVLLEMAQPIFHHRTKQFRDLMKQVTDDLKYLFQTERDVFTMTGSGTVAMEAAIANCVAPGEKVLCVRGGKFGERWSEIAVAFGASAVNLDVEWGTAASPEQIADALEKDPEIVAVAIQHCETSTGTVADVEGIARAVARTPAILIVDGITGIGALPFYMDRWQADIVVTGSQKALMLPPGLGFIAVSEKAWKRLEGIQSPTYYANLKAYAKGISKGDTPYTPACTLIVGAHKSLAAIRAESLEEVWAQTSLRARATRAAADALGLPLLSQSPADSVTALRVPDGVDGEKLTKVLAEKLGIRIAGGQAHLKGKIIQVASRINQAQPSSVVTIVVLDIRCQHMPQQPALSHTTAAQYVAMG